MMNLLVKVWAFKLKFQHASTIREWDPGSRFQSHLPSWTLIMNEITEEGSYYRLLQNMRNCSCLSSRGNSVNMNVSSSFLVIKLSDHISLLPLTTRLFTCVQVHYYDNFCLKIFYSPFFGLTVITFFLSCFFTSNLYCFILCVQYLYKYLLK